MGAFGSRGSLGARSAFGSYGSRGTYGLRSRGSPLPLSDTGSAIAIAMYNGVLGRFSGTIKSGSLVTLQKRGRVRTDTHVAHRVVAYKGPCL